MGKIMSVPNDWDATIERLRPSLLIWAGTQTPVWVRAKLDPADLVQQTLLEAERLREKLAVMPENELLSYLRRMLTNNAIDAARKYQRSGGEISLDAAAQSSLQLADWLAASDTSPSEQAARCERYERLAAGLARLPDAQRIAVEWRYLQGAKILDIARVLDRSEGAVTALLHRAVLSLREDLGILDL
jgi:RNA polymerase sigma-70 factor, ECF subfamily